MQVPPPIEYLYEVSYNVIVAIRKVSLHMELDSRPRIQVGQKTRPFCFKAYNFRNIEQIFTRFGTNQRHIILNIMP